MELDGIIDNWPVSVFGESYPGQGYDLHVTPYTGDDDESAPDDVYKICHSLSVGLYKTKRDAMLALSNAGFTLDPT